MKSCLALLAAAALAVPAAARVPKGLDLPLKPADGGPAVRLSSFEKKVVLVEFWATYCQPCRDAKPFFEDLQERYGGRGLVVLSVAAGEEPAVVRAYLKKHPTTLTVALDPASALEDALMLSGQPAMALFDERGELLWSGVGFSPSTKADLTWRIDRRMPGDPGRVPLHALE